MDRYSDFQFLHDASPDNIKPSDKEKGKMGRVQSLDKKMLMGIDKK